MTDSNRAQSEVAALLEERRRYEAWLAALEARREATAPHVFERVQADYRSRLQHVGERLGAHRGALKEERASIESRIALLEAEEQVRRDERAELDLRAQVGELSASEATEALRSLDSTLGELGGEKAQLRSRVETVRDLLEEGPAPAAPAPKAAATKAPEPRPPEPKAPEPRASQPKVPAPTPGGGANFDELAFLSSVVGADRPGGEGRRTPARSAWQERASEAEAASAASNGPGAPAPSAEDRRDVLVDAGHGESPLTGVLGSGGTVREPAASEALLSALSARRDQAPGAAPLAANVPSNTPIVLRSSGAIEQPKTLKCNECGAMNYATEWYCERCGGELAAL